MTLKEKVNELVIHYNLVMFEQRGNKVFMLWKHYKFTDWRKKAVRIFVGTGSIAACTKDKLYTPDNTYFYVTHTL